MPSYSVAYGFRGEQNLRRSSIFTHLKKVIQMISQQLQPDEIFQFVEILNRSTKADFLPDLSEGSQEIYLVDKLCSRGLVNAKRRANNGIYVALLTVEDRVAAQEAHQWAENEGRQGEVQLALYDYLKKVMVKARQNS